MTTEQSYQRLRQYADDLLVRLNAQKEWLERYNVSDPLHVPLQVWETDPYPNTKDFFPAQRIADMLVLILATFEKARRD